MKFIQKTGAFSATADGVTLSNLMKSFLVITVHYVDMETYVIKTITLGAFRLYEVSTDIIILNKYSYSVFIPRISVAHLGVHPTKIQCGHGLFRVDGKQQLQAGGHVDRLCAEHGKVRGADRCREDPVCGPHDP